MMDFDLKLSLIVTAVTMAVILGFGIIAIAV
ncbi:YnhF family membrane protein [Photobacterium nomapromontoriensis]